MLALFKRYTFSKFQSVDEKRSSGGGNQTKVGYDAEMEAWYDQLIVSKRLKKFQVVLIFHVCKFSI